MDKVYADLLLSELDISVPANEIKNEMPKNAPLPHPCDAPSIETREGYEVCEACGLVLRTDMIEKAPPAYRSRRQYRHEGAAWLGEDEDSYMPRKRFYKPLTHFRQHLRSYLFARNVDIPAEIMAHLRDTIDIEDRNAYSAVKTELKRMGAQRFYKDVFTVIYALGGRKPHVTPEQVDSMCNYFKRWYYNFNRLERFGKHNTPSIYMLMEIILREFGHEPYYYIPSLKSDKLRQRVLQIYDEVKCLCQG
jgi:hypothetical protein